ncbi:MAG TPA: hypothetical protein PKG81_06130, partial [Candidatus Omnitrophota bacterium]|nr:hypothetical protein [Candidatus Omnitrophota bacterium]
PNMLKKATEIGAILFMVISLLLAIMTARSGKSLFQQMGVPVLPQMPVSAPAAAGSQPAQSSSAGQTQAAPVQQAVQQVPAPVQAPVKAAQQAQAPVENK